MKILISDTHSQYKSQSILWTTVEMATGSVCQITTCTKKSLWSTMGQSDKDRIIILESSVKNVIKFVCHIY